MPRPFELSSDAIRANLEVLVRTTIADLVSEFLIMPKGSGFMDYPVFRDAYEVLRRHTEIFTKFDKTTVDQALRENSRVFGVLRAILGMTPPEWAELARSENGSDVTQGAARSLDRTCRAEPSFICAVETRHAERIKRLGVSERRSIPRPKSLERIDAMVQVAIEYITRGSPSDGEAVVHRLSKFDTERGLESLQYAGKEDVPYPVLLYERYLGRPFAGHRDAVSELVGEVMENAIEDRLRAAGIPYRKTRRAERIPGFGQAPDFCIPDEVKPAVIIEAKVTSDDGTARDKVARIKTLVTQRDRHVEKGWPRYEVVACIDGRGFKQRREDMRQMILALEGKVFTTATLDRLIEHTRLREFVVKGK
jgi:hypothetical protein